MLIVNSHCSLVFDLLASSKEALLRNRVQPRKYFLLTHLGLRVFFFKFGLLFNAISFLGRHDGIIIKL